jgi:hypothetical protein
MEAKAVVPTSSAPADLFKTIDWSFFESVPDQVHTVHPYPAKYIPEIPAAALSLAPKEGQILDPFCGIGTTLIESVRSGREAIGIDLNPIATMVAEAKLSGWSEEDADALPRHKEGLLNAARESDVDLLDRARERIPRVDHWFDPVSQAALAGTAGYISALDPTDPWRVRLGTAVSSIVVRISRQESDTRYAAVPKTISLDGIVASLDRAVDSIGRAASTLATQVRANATAQTITADATKLAEIVPPDTVGAAIFSPPYPNAYEYWLYHKYRMYWMGFDPLKVRAGEIGARPFYSGSGKLTEDDFAAQMGKVFAGLKSVLLKDGIVLMIVGDSRIRGRDVDNAAVLARCARENSFEVTGLARRSIKATRRSFNQAIARAKYEHVMLFERA